LADDSASDSRRSINQYREFGKNYPVCPIELVEVFPLKNKVYSHPFK